ncbi:MAG: hypothetical protein R3C10_23470 [Pirellulales bacterium]
MHQSTTKLLSIASEPIAGPVGVTHDLNKWGPLGHELAEMLNEKNGFYAYESALLVRPLRNARAPLGLLEWNAPKSWKADYVENLSDAFFFAEDVFGGQYCLREAKICAFDPETGVFEEMSSSLGAWANDVMSDYEFRTGYPLAHEWQIGKAPLPLGMRLLPKTPFVCGGKYEVENLYSVADVKGMLFRASIANQIRDLPDGAEIVFKTTYI